MAAPSPSCRLHDDGTITMVRQYRTPAQAVLLEIPAGGIDPGESPEAAAHRELAEETGLRASRLEHVAAFYTAAGFCSEFMHLYIATGLSEAIAHQDDDENIETIRLALEDALSRVATGEVRDAKSLIALLTLQLRRA